MLRCKNLSVQRQGRSILKDIAFELAPGELMALIGPNGAGKSTLLGTLAGLHVPQGGSIELNREPLGNLHAREKARRIAYLEQHGRSNWPMTVERIVMLGRTPWLRPWHKPQASDQQAVNRALQQTDCEALRERQVDRLSGGELTRVLLARALAGEPQLLLADEPIAALDVAHQLQIMALLRDFAQGNRSAVVVLHDLSLAARFCDTACLLDEGQIVARDKAFALVREHRVEDVFSTRLAVIDDPVVAVLPVETTQKT